ncbi:MAG: RNA 2',3'-cyclic phosphodiesterase [Methylococcales bacterium]
MTESLPSKRLFFALWPPEKVRQQIQQSRKLYCPTGGRWTRLQNFHATLVFLGDIAIQRIPVIGNAVSEIEAKVFEMQLDSIRPAPVKGMVWLVPGVVPHELLQLVFALRSSIAALNFEIEQHHYQPHVTLIRKLPEAFDQCQIDDSVRWPVTSFALVESKQARGSSVYIRSKIWRLRE